MALSVIGDTIEFDGMDSSGKRTATRHMKFSHGPDDTQMDLAESPLLPDIGDVHPDYTLWTVSSIDKPEYVDVPAQYWVKVHYEYGGDGSSGALSGKKPWELGAQDFSISTFEKEKPLRQIFQPKGIAVGNTETGGVIYGSDKWVDLKNSAGAVKTASDTVTVLRMSFTLNYKHKKGVILPMPTDFSYNAKTVKVCNFVIPPYAGKLLPFQTTLHTVYASNGTTVKYEYESAQIVLEIMQEDTWITKYLNTGTQVLWKKEKSGTTYISPGAVYRYRALPGYTSEADYENRMKYTNPVFGSMEDMLVQRDKFLKAGGRRDRFSYEEMNEELPLKLDGSLYQEALTDPASHPYLYLGGFARAGASWAKYNLPEKR